MGLQVSVPASNKERAEWAQKALDEFMAVTGASEEDAVADLLNGLMHLCRRDAEFIGDFDEECERAKRNFETELG